MFLPVDASSLAIVSKWFGSLMDVQLSLFSVTVKFHGVQMKVLGLVL